MRRVVRFGSLLNHLICQDQEGWRERDPKRLRSLEVEDQLVLGRLLHGEGGGLGAFQNLVDIGGGTPEQVRKARAIGHQRPISTSSRKLYIAGRRLVTVSSTRRTRWDINSGSRSTMSASAGTLRMVGKP